MIGSLYCIRMQPKLATFLSLFAHQGSDLFNRLQRPDFIVCQHDRNEDCLRLQSGAHVFSFHHTHLINGQTCDFPAAFFKFVSDPPN